MSDISGVTAHMRDAANKIGNKSPLGDILHSAADLISMLAQSNDSLIDAINTTADRIQIAQHNILKVVATAVRELDAIHREWEMGCTTCYPSQTSWPCTSHLVAEILRKLIVVE